MLLSETGFFKKALKELQQVKAEMTAFELDLEELKNETDAEDKPWEIQRALERDRKKGLRP